MQWSSGVEQMCWYYNHGGHVPEVWRILCRISWGGCWSLQVPSDRSNICGLKYLVKDHPYHKKMVIMFFSLWNLVPNSLGKQLWVLVIIIDIVMIRPSIVSMLRRSFRASSHWNVCFTCMITMMMMMIRIIMMMMIIIMMTMINREVV